MKAVLFDLDNTLYDNRQYFLGSFREISRYVARKTAFSEKEVFDNLFKIWQEKTSYYPYLFDDFLKIKGVKNKEMLNEIISIFNNYNGKLEPYEDALHVLENLESQGCQLGLITDGNPKRQERKIKSLGIGKFFKTMIYAKDIEPKPSKKPYLLALKKIKADDKDKVYYVGDNPLVDFEGAKKTGMTTIRIKKGQFSKIAKDKYVDFEINSLKELVKII